MKKVKAFISSFWASLIVFLSSAAPALAVGGIAEQDAETTASKIVALLNEVVRPMGALVIFVAVAWTAFKLIITANKPHDRAEALAAVPYILGGGIALGAVMLIAGFIVGLMVKAGQ